MVRRAQPGPRGHAACPHGAAPLTSHGVSVSCQPVGHAVLGIILSLSCFSRPRHLASRDDDVTARLLAAAQGRAGSVLRPQPAGRGLQLCWETRGPGWAAQGCRQGSGLGSGGSLWGPEHLICSGRADSSPEPARGGMCGNPTAAVVPRLCKVHIVLRLPACSPCHGLLFQGSWKSPAIQPSRHGRPLPGRMLCWSGWEREGSSWWVHRENTKILC